MKTIKILMLFSVVFVSGCGLFGDSNAKPSLASGKSLEIYVGMPYEDARKALEKFNCEDISAYISYIKSSNSPGFKYCWFDFPYSQIGIEGDENNKDGVLKVTSLIICNSQDLRNHKQEHWYNFDKLTVKDGRMNLDGFVGTLIYIGMDYSKAVELIKNAKVTEIAEVDGQISYKTKYSLQPKQNELNALFTYDVNVVVKSKSIGEGAVLVDSIKFSWNEEAKQDDYYQKNNYEPVNCAIIDIVHPRGISYSYELVK